MNAPLDPNSERGKATAERLDLVLGEIWLNICRRRAAARRAAAA